MTKRPQNQSRIGWLAVLLAALALVGVGYLLGRLTAPRVAPLATHPPEPAVPGPIRDRVRQAALDGLQPLAYRELWDALAITDAHPDQPGHVQLIYSRRAEPVENHGGDVGQWNREHLWPRSRGGVTLGAGAGTDLHLIRPCDVQTNSRRGNLWFDDGGRAVVLAGVEIGCRADGDSWEPPAEVRGDIARALAYGANAYDELPDLRLVNGPPTDARDGAFGDLETLRKWSRLDPPDESERRRNAVVEQLQGNRNPFVGDPGLFEVVWPDE